MISKWRQGARRELLSLRGRGSLWSYRRGGSPSVEPTSLACLGLLASGDRDSPAPDLVQSCEAADWLCAIQRADGALPVSQSLRAPGWSTPYAIILWNKLGGYERQRARACRWLLSTAGETHQPKPGDEVVGHDPSLAGWPWVEGTHSWVEPTAMAILALDGEGFGDHSRVREGTRMILNRALNSGGWNSGNKSVFGRELRPQPCPTALALLALSARRERARAVTAAVDYLRAFLPHNSAALSRAWAILALRACSALPIEAETWLRETYEHGKGRADFAVSLALLLLAGSEAGPSLLLGPGPTAPTSQPRH